MHRDPHQRGLDDGVVGEGAVEVAGIEVEEPIPEGEVRRGGLLGLERDDAVHCLDHVQRLAPQQQLPAQGGPVELSRGESHSDPIGSATSRAPRLQSRRDNDT
jgi:hypothetical protein